MHPLPHVYTTIADGAASGTLELRNDSLPALGVERPPEFGGEGNHWSPEGLQCAAVASCFILSFRAVARGARLDWQKLECKVEGTLQRQDGLLRFTHFAIFAALTIDSEQESAKYRRALEQAERGCLIANSLTASRELKIDIVPGRESRPAPKSAERIAQSA
jgi:uncharacterized OsmC-like protein